MDQVERHHKLLEAFGRFGIKADEASYALYQLQDLAEISEHVTQLVRELEGSAMAGNVQLAAVTRSLAALKVELYEHLPDHLGRLKRPLDDLFKRACEVEAEAES